MNDKEKLIKFIQLKNEIIEKETDLKYITQIDIDIINKWNDNICKRIYTDLTRAINDLGEKGLTENTCIWCIKDYIDHNNIISNIKYLECISTCYGCEYKTQHGKCDESDSLYQKYAVDKVVNLLTNEVYKDMLKKIEDI